MYKYSVYEGFCSIVYLFVVFESLVFVGFRFVRTFWDVCCVLINLNAGSQRRVDLQPVGSSH